MVQETAKLALCGFCCRRERPGHLNNVREFPGQQPFGCPLYMKQLRRPLKSTACKYYRKRKRQRGLMWQLTMWTLGRAPLPVQHKPKRTKSMSRFKAHDDSIGLMEESC